MRILLSTIAAGMMLVLANAVAVSAELEPCFADWTAAAAAVKTEGLVPVDQLAKLAPARLGGQIVRTILCLADGHYSYKLVIRDVAGQIKTITVDAKKPFDR